MFALAESPIHAPGQGALMGAELCIGKGAIAEPGITALAVVRLGNEPAGVMLEGILEVAGEILGTPQLLEGYGRATVRMTVEKPHGPLPEVRMRPGQETSSSTGQPASQYAFHSAS